MSTERQNINGMFHRTDLGETFDPGYQYLLSMRETEV